MQRDESFKDSPNTYLPYRNPFTGGTWSWVRPKKSSHLSICNAGLAHSHTQKLQRLWGAAGTSLHVYGDRKGEGRMATQIFQSILFFNKHNAARQQKGVFFGPEVLFGKWVLFQMVLLLRIVPVLNERSLFITSRPSDYIKQRWTNIFKQVFFDSIFCITGK